jgi:hypothetical protein
MSQLSLVEAENNVVLKGIRYIVSKNPSKKTPLNLYFLFAGDAELELRILEGILNKGYTVSRVWFVDTAYKRKDRQSDIVNKLKNIPYYTNNLSELDQDILISLRHNTNLKFPNKITSANMFKIDNKISNVIFLTDFSQLTALMENYIDTNEKNITFAIHSQAIGEGAGEKIGTFYKMYFTKFNKPIVFMWREYPYIAVVEPHPESKNLSPIDVRNYARTRQRELMYGNEDNVERYTYKGLSYPIRIGKKGGKYIIINGIKKYIHL